jgi:disulfide bond formation protein DsbB
MGTGTMASVLAATRRAPAKAILALMLLLAMTVIVAALGFEHLGGYDPCALCLQQRYAYYLCIPAMGVALVLLRARQQEGAALLVLIGLAFLVNAALGTYQAGAEWKFWDPPATCAAVGALPSFDARSLTMDRVPALCGVASWRFLGLSFAGWNTVASTVLAVGTLTAASRALRKPAGAA